MKIIEVCDVRFEPNRKAEWGQPDGAFSTTGYVIKDRGRVLVLGTLSWRDRIAILLGARVAVSVAYVR